MELSWPAMAGAARVKQIREADTDWRRWLLTKPDRPFSRLYFEFRLCLEFSSGIPDQWMSHGIDMWCTTFWTTISRFRWWPAASTLGGTGVKIRIRFQALLEYPKGFLVSYSTSFGNDSDSFTRIMGEERHAGEYRGRGQQRWKEVEEKGHSRGESVSNA